MEKKEQELKCQYAGCEGKEFKVENIKPESFTIVNEKAVILYGRSEYTYRCLKCQKIFTSDLAPKNKKILLG